METVETRSLLGKCGALLAPLGLGVVLLASPAPAAACSCSGPLTVESSYRSASDVFAARIISSIALGQRRWYAARVQETFKGCSQAEQIVWLTSNLDSAACGVSLDSGDVYLINAQSDGRRLGLPTFVVSACGNSMRAEDLTAHDREFLLSREVCCGADCACADGTDPVRCFANPCQVTPACAEATECVANYCGGCNAEFYDTSGRAVCDGGCTADADCPANQWCRERAPTDAPAADSGAQCVPFASLGEPCGGFAPPWAARRCGPGLVCDPSAIIDAPGVCRAPCRSYRDCAPTETCGVGGVCSPQAARCEEGAITRPDSCNTCVCQRGRLLCTLMACLDAAVP